MKSFFHPILTNPQYNTFFLSWQNGGLHFFKPMPEDGSGILILDTYYLAYLVCFAVSALLVRRWLKKAELRLSRDQAIDAFLCVGIGLMLGAKLAYVLFYNFEFYQNNPSQIFLNWSGMASHGAITGGLIGLILYAHKKGLPKLHLLDYSALCACIVPIFIRTANFLNAELYGRSAPNWLPWKMRFPMFDGQGRTLFIDKQNQVFQLNETAGGAFVSPSFQKFSDYESFSSIQSLLPKQIWSVPVETPTGSMGEFARLITDPRHPSQFYQLIVSGVLLSLFLYWLKRKKRKDGFLFCSFLMAYGATRFFMEYFRQPDSQRSSGLFEYISMGQILSLAMIFIGFFVWKKYVCAKQLKL